MHFQNVYNDCKKIMLINTIKNHLRDFRKVHKKKPTSQHIADIDGNTIDNL